MARRASSCRSCGKQYKYSKWADRHFWTCLKANAYHKLIRAEITRLTEKMGKVVLFSHTATGLTGGISHFIHKAERV